MILETWISVLGTSETYLSVGHWVNFTLLKTVKLANFMLIPFSMLSQVIEAGTRMHGMGASTLVFFVCMVFKHLWRLLLNISNWWFWFGTWFILCFRYCITFASAFELVLETVVLFSKFYYFHIECSCDLMAWIMIYHMPRGVTPQVYFEGVTDWYQSHWL